MTIQQKKIQSDFRSRFEERLKTSGLIAPGQKIFVACSGGPDSVSLFLLLKAIAKKWKLRLGLLHFNHGLRGEESKRDEGAVRKLARRFRVPLEVGKGKGPGGISAKESLEESARKERYGFLAQAAKKRRVHAVAVAHTEEDQAETILMRVLQGTGLRGLLGVRACFEMGQARFIRPLLDFSRAEVLEFLTKEKISFCRDSSNQSLRFLRNKLRLKFLPWVMREVNPRAVQALARIPKILSQEEDVLRELEQKAWQKYFKASPRSGLACSRAAFSKLPSAIQFRLLDRALKHMDKRSGLLFESWQTFRQKFARSRYEQSFPGAIQISLTPLKVILYKK